MSDPLAYFLTWTTYGTWLPGDDRGWVERGAPGVQPGDPERLEEAARHMSEDAVYLTPEQRQLVHHTIVEHCTIRGWQLHAVSVRTNHVHVVVTADEHPDQVMEQLRAWCTRRLNEHAGPSAKRKRWWTKGGSTIWINDEQHFHTVVHYVLYGQ